MNLFTSWHDELLIPVFDVFRMYLIHPESGLLFKQVGGGIEQLAILLKNIKETENNTEQSNTAKEEVTPRAKEFKNSNNACTPLLFLKFIQYQTTKPS